MATNRYQHLKKRVPASQRPYNSSMQRNYKSKISQEKKEIEFMKKLESWKNL